jgi:hypothetical protein
VGRGRLILTVTVTARTFRFFVVLFFSSSVYRTLFFLRGTRTFNNQVSYCTRYSISIHSILYSSTTRHIITRILYLKSQCYIYVIIYII